MKSLIALILVMTTGAIIFAGNQTEQESNIQENMDSLIVVSGNSVTSASTPLVTPKQRVYGVYSGSSYYYLLTQYDWNINIAYAIMLAESGGNPNAENWKDNHRVCSGSFGLFQLACFRGNINTLKDPEINVKMAYELYKREGWRPWGAYTNRSYLKFLYN
jgi:hypothetical protein